MLRGVKNFCKNVHIDDKLSVTWESGYVVWWKVTFNMFPRYVNMHIYYAYGTVSEIL